VWKEGLSGRTLETLEKEFGIKREAITLPGRWSYDQDEQAAKAFEHWLWTGTAKSETLKPLLRMCSKWMRRSYRTIKNASFNVKVSRETARAFESMFTPKPDQIVEAQKELGVLPVEGPRAQRVELAPAEKFTPLSGRQKTARELADAVKGWWGTTEFLEHFPEGRKILDLASNADVDMDMMVGRFRNELNDRYVALKKAKGAIKWLMTSTDGTYRNLRKLIEPELDSPSIPIEFRDAIVPWVQLAKDIQLYFGNKAVEAE
ncbi:unnamed protein product, partial [marine sediment metagenome]